MTQSSHLSGALVLEGQWYEGLDDATSVESTFRFLRDLYGIPYVLRNADVPEQLNYWLSRWKGGGRRELKRYGLIYFGYHGKAGRISLGDGDWLTLAELAEMLGPLAENRIVHFGTCATLGVSTEELRTFLRDTGALAISGYTKNVDFLNSSCIELQYLGWTQDYVKLPYLWKRLIGVVPSLVESQGFRLVSSRFDSQQAGSETLDGS